MSDTITTPTEGDTPPPDPGTIRITIDGHDHSITPLDIIIPELFNQLVAHVEAASTVVVFNWDLIPSLPLEARQAFVMLTTINGPVISVCVGDTGYPDAFAATLALTFNADDLGEVSRYQDFVFSVAAQRHPGAVAAAARRIQDWLRGQGTQPDDVRVLARRIREQVTQPEASIDLTPQVAADMVLAAMQAERTVRGEIDIATPPCRYFQGEMYVWADNYWRPANHFTENVTRILQPLDKHPLSNQFVQSVIGNIRAKVLLDPGQNVPPLFIEGDPPVCRPQHVLVFANGTIDLDEMRGTGSLPTLRPHDARVFATSALPYDYIPTATCPLWEATIREILPPSGPDDHRTEVLQEFLGYISLIGDCRFEKFLVLVGIGANGKSTVLAVISAVFGNANVSHVGLESLGSDPHLLQTAHKSVNIASEMHRMQRVEEGILKALVSGEPRVVNRKYLPAVTFIPTAKLIFATNHLPQFSDTSMGIWRRMIVTPFNERFDGARCDLSRKDRLLEELPGILNWTLSGALRLLQQGAFTQCGVCESTIRAYQMDADPFRQFADQCCDIAQDRAVLAADIYTAYRIFCEQNGRSPKGNSEFGRQVAGLTGVIKHRESSGDRAYYYEGLGLRVVSTLGVYPRPPQRTEAAHSRGTMVGRPTTS